MARRTWFAGLLVIGAAVLFGCPPERFENSVPALASEIETIRSNNRLTAQEKRQRLGELGLSPLVINQVLRNERTGNQFGGDLRTARDKVAGGMFRALTPDEVQIYQDGANADESSPGIPTISDANAQAIVNFFSDAQIDTADQLNVFLADPANEVPSDVPAGVLQELFVDFDPDDINDQLP